MSESEPRDKDIRKQCSNDFTECYFSLAGPSSNKSLKTSIAMPLKREYECSGEANEFARAEN